MFDSTFSRMLKLKKDDKGLSLALLLELKSLPHFFKRILFISIVKMNLEKRGETFHSVYLFKTVGDQCHNFQKL